MISSRMKLMILVSGMIWCPADSTRQPDEVSPNAEASDLRQHEDVYEAIFRLVDAGIHGRFGVRVDCLSGCEVQQSRDDFAKLNQFLAMDRKEALKKSVASLNYCIKKGLVKIEWLYAPCEGALASVRFFEDVSEDRIILIFFRRYLYQELQSDQIETLGNVFYPRYLGKTWYQDRPLRLEWVTLVEELDKKFKLYTPEQLELVRDRFLLQTQ